MPVQETVVVPETAAVTVALEPAHSALNSLLLLARADGLSGLGEWVVRTASHMTSEQQQRNYLVMIGLHYAILPERSWPSFPLYVDHLAALDPAVLRDRMLLAYARTPLLEQGDCRAPGDASIDWAMLQTVGSYLDFLRARFPPESIDEEMETQAYRYVIDPPAMQKLIVSHLREMWQQYLAEEWQHIEPLLCSSVEAFQQLDLTSASRLEIAQAVSGQKLDAKWQRELDRFSQIVFVPSAHIGPYLGKLGCADTLWVLFGARLPAGVQSAATDLTRAELLVRLNALTDDNRLGILRLVFESGELSSREIIESMQLSQSAASRHLQQLSATGYLCERRCNGAKCYTLDSERIEETLRALAAFLLGR